MADIQPVPKVACDVCNKQAHKLRSTSNGWRRPADWGTLKVPPSFWGRYPNHIDMTDVCPDCCKIINKAVSDAIDSIHNVAAEVEPTP